MVSPSERRAVGRPRCEQTHEAIISAATRLLEQTPYAEVSVEAIALAAGVSKATIYRRWPGKAELVVEVLLRQALLANRPFAAPQFRDHLLQGMHDLWGMLTGPLSEAIAGVIAEAQSNEPLREAFYQGFIREMQAIASADLEHAIQRGEVVSDIPREQIFDQLFGTLQYRALVARKPVDDAYLERLVSAVLAPWRR